VADAAAGLRFRITLAGDALVTMARGTLRPRFHCRALADWVAAFEHAGFRVETAPMSAGTPFANVMLIARPALAATGGSG